MIEAKGIATTVIGLVRPHLEQTAPPRALWVPFQLGRPLGEPEDAAFQRAVLMQALSLLERPEGRPILEDFDADAPSEQDNPAWTCPVRLTSRSSRPAAALVEALAEELTEVIPYWQAARNRFSRTTVLLSKAEPATWPPYAAAFLSGQVPSEGLVQGQSPALGLRLMCDDLKALYLEAAQSSGPMPSSRQLNDWFWNTTVAADVLRALRAAALASEHAGFKTAGSRFIVPAPFIQKA